MSFIQNISRVHPPSISTVSDLTINTSFAARQNHEDLSSLVDDSILENVSDYVFGPENQVKIESGKNIQVGDTYHYNFYSPPSNEGAYSHRLWINWNFWHLKSI